MQMPHIEPRDLSSLSLRWCALLSSPARPAAVFDFVSCDMDSYRIVVPAVVDGAYQSNIIDKDERQLYFMPMH